MQRKSPFLLLELVISLAIMGLILGILLMGFQQTLLTKKELRREREIVLSRQRLMLRLSSLFRSVESCEPDSKGGYRLRYEGGIDPDFHFRGALKGLLTIDHERLKLTSWPEKGEPRLEIFDEGIQTFSLLFFDEAKGEFSSSFPKKKPFMMKAILITSINETVELPLFL